MKATIVIPPTGESPPQMPVEGAVMGELFDSLGWDLWVLDVAGFNYTADGLRVEVKREDPDIIVFQCNAQQYRFAKQYVKPIREESRHPLLVAVTKDLKIDVLKKWLPVNFVIEGVPTGILRQVAGRLETRNLEGISNRDEDAKAKLPEYHASASHILRHMQARGGLRFADIPTTLFGKPTEATDVAETITKLRMKFAICGFNLLGPMNVQDPDWLDRLLLCLERHELVGEPVNLTWNCEIPDATKISTPLIRQLADHGARHIVFDWLRDKHDHIEHVIDTCQRANVQPIVRLNFGPSTTKLDYLEMGRLLSARQGLMFATKYLDNPDRYDDEEYLLSLTNGAYPPKSQNLHQDVQMLAARELVSNRDVDRLVKFAESR